MTYPEALDHLSRLGPELPPTDPTSNTSRRKFDLAHMRALCAALGNPQDKVPSVLIAGTNGKGSTAATLASILNSAGYRTGLYTSPHLLRVNERIQLSHAILPSEYGTSAPGPPHLTPEMWEGKAINLGAPHLDSEMWEGKATANGPLSLTPIADEDFANLYTQVEAAAHPLVESGELPHLPSFFERLTAVAFLYFARSHADIMILEVGLGGRLDATNIVQPLISILTDIALDHQEWLGNTITEIATEKAGILRPHGTLITLSQHPEANTAIGAAAAALEVHAINAAPYLPPAERNPDTLGAPHLASEMWDGVTPNPDPSPLPHNHYTLSIEDQLLEVNSPLPGQHQQRNIALALAAAIELRNKSSYNLPNPAIEAGIRATHWPGRLEFVAPNLLLDVAHNPAGAWTLRAAIAALPSTQPRTLIFSCLRDKNLTEISRILFPLFDSTSGDPNRRHDHIVLAPIASPRAANVDDLLAAAHALDIPAHAAPHLAAALAQARAITPPGGLILATGSVYLVGEIHALAKDLPGAP